MADASPARSGAPKLERPRVLKWHHHLAALFIFLALRLVSWSWRLRLVDEQQALRTLEGPVILCLWHNRLALSMRAWERYGRPALRCRGLVALISASHDGGVLARTLRYFRVEAVRGSSSRRGPQALLELTSWADREYSVAITPDGPRGPRYEVRDGALSLAQVSGLPILPVSVDVGWKVSLRSWDRFQVPLPFSRCVVRIGPPLRVPRGATAEDKEALRQELRERLMMLTRDERGGGG